MQDAMQHQNLHFIGRRVVQAPGVLAGDIGGNRHFPGNAVSLPRCHRQRWKRQYVRGLVRPAESPVERL